MPAVPAKKSPRRLASSATSRFHCKLIGVSGLVRDDGCFAADVVLQEVVKRFPKLVTRPLKSVEPLTAERGQLHRLVCSCVVGLRRMTVMNDFALPAKIIGIRTDDAIELRPEIRRKASGL